ncbi:hypothetical protein ACWEQL_00335 [Kitasatospora sp. NPDC004240]
MAQTARGRAELPEAKRRKVLLAADPVTGEVKGSPAVKAALVKSGLAVARGRIGATYLTPTGLQMRSELLAEPAPAEPAVPTAGGFSPATGDGPPLEPADADLRAAEVARAWEGLLEVRRLSGTPAAPATWERTRAAWAVALALEAAGLPPCAVDHRGRRVRTGYRVVPGSTEAEARVEWRGPASSRARQEAEQQLEVCAARLAERGWESRAYLASGGLRFLTATPAD